MENVRIGNSVHVSWRLFNNNGSQYMLSGKIRRLWIISAALEKEITSYGIQGRNELIFSVPADDLIRYGTYKVRLTIRESESETEDATYELTQVFQIVSQSYPEASGAVGGVVDLSFTSVLNNVVVERIEGLSAYEIAVNNGYEGTEQEWIAMYDNAVAAANNAAEDAIAATEAMTANEGSRQSAESARDSAEQSRIAAEAARVSAEQSRVSAETARETQASADHTRAESDHTTAAGDHTIAANDHTRAESDHTTAAADHTAAQASLINDVAVSVSDTVGTPSATVNFSHNTLSFHFDNIKGETGPAAEVNEDDLDFNAQDKMQFADRAYNTTTPDGLGYVILRKNKTFAQQVTATNTVYEIRYDFDLNAASVTIPAGCVLKFNGGSVVNGTIVGTQTLINSENMCFGNDVSISGTWSNETIYTKWLDFVSSNDGTTDNSVCFKQLQGLINGTRGCKVEFEPGYYQTQIIGMEPEGYVEVDGTTYPKWAMNTYMVDKRIVLHVMEVPYVDINLNGSTIKAINITCPGWNMLRLTGVEKGYVHDGTLIGMADGFSYPAYVNYSGSVVANYEFSSLLIQSGGNFTAKNISCKYATGDGIMVGSGVWYFRAGDVRPSGVVSANGAVYFPAGGYTIENCEVSYCGRNGITLHSSDEGSLTGCHIHHIGSDGGSGVIGTDGIMGRNPRAGIDVEFEDGQGLKPVLSWDNLYIHDCGRTSFTFSATQSRMRQFSATNCQFILFGLPNNMNAEGTMTFSGCHFEHNGGEGGLIGTGITYTDCEFILKARSITLGAVTFVNCVFDDQIEDTGSDMVFAQSQYKSVFRGCKLTVRHNIGYLQDKTFYDCVLNLYAKTFIYACGIECYNCEFNKDPEDDTIYSYSFSPGNYAAQTRGHFWFIGCRFDRLRGTGGGTGDFSLNTGTYPVVFDGCKFGALAFYHGASRSDITIRNSRMDTLFVGKYQDDGDTIKPLVIDNCDIDSISSAATGSRPTEMTGCRVGVLSGGNYKLRMINFTRCVVTNNVARNANYPDTYVVGVESVFDFKVATATVNFDLTDCYVKGAVTEATFAGTKKGCTFETPLPVIGTTQPSGGFLPNVFYTLGELAGNTTFTLATPTDANIVNHYYWTFDTPSTAPTITWPTGLTWVGGSAPTVAASKHYEVSVINGIATFMEV